MPKLFMCLVGCTLPDRHIEQHDIFFAIGESIIDIIPAIIDFWPEAVGKLHLDAWRAVTCVNGFIITVVAKMETTSKQKLFFINLGGYKKHEFEEFHYKMIVAAENKSAAVKLAKLSAFYKHTGFKGAPAHIDDKFGVDVDDLFEINDLLPHNMKQQYSLLIEPNVDVPVDEIHLGYFRLDKADKWVAIES